MSKMLENKKEEVKAPVEPDKKSLSEAVKKEQEARGKKATNEIQAILEKYDVVLVGVPDFMPRGNGEFSVVTRVQVAVKS